MALQKPDFDSLLFGGKGPAYWGFGKQPVVGQYIEGYIVEKDSRHSTKFQTKAQRDQGLPAEYEYFVGKSKVTSSEDPDVYLEKNKQARPIWELITVLRTAMRDPEDSKDEGLRTYQWPPAAKKLLAQAASAQGIKGGLPVESFVRVTLVGLTPVEGLDTPKREYRVDLWAPGEQPSPSPAQPAAQVVQQQFQAPAPAQQFQQSNQWTPPPAQQQFQQVPVTVGSASAQQQFPDEMLAMMKQQGMACPVGNEARW